MYNEYNNGSNGRDYYDPDNLYSYRNTNNNRQQEQYNNYYEYEPPKNKKGGSKGKAFLVFLCIILIAGFTGYQGGKYGSQISSQNKSSSGNSSKGGIKIEEATGSPMTIKEIAKKVSDSVVEIRTESVVRDSWIQEYVTEGAGSGVIVKSDGHIMTNYHVINGARRIYVKITPGSDKEYEARVVRTNSGHDVALLKINAKNLSAATLGNSDNVEAGDLAVVVGNPLGKLGDSISAGIISSKERTITMENRQMSLMQTDASVNPGNSGGGLFNDHGQLVGLIVAKSAGENIEGLGFAIPIKAATSAVKLK